MKKVLLVLVAIIASLSLNAQFVITKNGIVDSINNTKNYYVVNYEGYNKQKLFNDYLIAISNRCVSPKDVISKVDGEQISLNIIIKNSVLKTKFIAFDLNTTIVFEFKDDKVKISPLINSMTNIYKGKTRYLYIRKKVYALFETEYSIFKENGDLKNKKAKYTLEKTINNFIKSIISNVDDSKNNDW